MNLQVLENWITALRTTTARQIFGVTSDGRGGKCALGVVWSKHRIAFGHIKELEITQGDIDIMGLQSVAYMPSPPETTAAEDAFLRKIVQMNDGNRRTFAQIADWLEEQSFKLFPVEELFPEQENVQKEEMILCQ